MSKEIVEVDEAQVEAKKYCDDTVKLSKGVHIAVFHLAERLKIVRDERKWEGAGYSSFDLFLDEEMKISQSAASKMIGILELFQNIPAQKLALAGGWSNLAEVVSIVRKEGDPEKWVDILIEHPREAVRAMLAEARSGIKEDECLHEDFYLLKVCRTCGQKFRVYETEEEIKNHIHTGEVVATLQDHHPATVS